MAFSSYLLCLAIENSIRLPLRIPRLTCTMLIASSITLQSRKNLQNWDRIMVKDSSVSDCIEYCVYQILMSLLNFSNRFIISFLDCYESGSKVIKSWMSMSCSYGFACTSFLALIVVSIFRCSFLLTFAEESCKCCTSTTPDSRRSTMRSY